ncbi:WecB/TagA/CpsF family glycosyltransferase [Peribacillus phoenicis]|uniref:WecB/TagA/CpsF family glycosyltransferase n=1 Tax=unclassified Peribacillus TaxID=2675266 RepID=UPI0039A1B2A9
MTERIKMLNFYVDSVDMDETISRIEKIIEIGNPTQHVVVNASKAVLLQKDQKLREIVNNCELVNADGQSIVWASKFLGNSLPERVTGIDIMERLLQTSSKKGYKVYFFGAKEEVVKHYKKVYPSLEVVGYRNGYFELEDESEIVRNISISSADILLVGFSSPMKEYWLSKYNKQLNVPFQMGVGGSFDIIAGVTKRAPKWMQNVGLEWFYRFIQEPGRMGRRYFIGNLKFLFYTFKEKFSR